MKLLISFVICIAVFFCGCETQNTASNIVAGDIPKIVLDAGHATLKNTIDQQNYLKNTAKQALKMGEFRFIRLVIFDKFQTLC